MLNTIVIKLGTSVLTSGTTKLDKARMAELVRQCARLKQAGYRIIIVTSGGIAAGREFLGYPDLPSGIASKQLLASVGQIKLIQQWEQLFSIYSIPIGQMLLSRADLEDRERFLNARDMLLALLEHHIVPVINENDAVATAEIKVGDNDNLSALVAVLAQADTLVLLTDIDGLYTANPHTTQGATLVREVEKITQAIWEMGGGVASSLGTGGMATKLQAAKYACGAGIDVVIANGGEENVLERIASNQAIGTRFLGHKTLGGRKHWVYGAPVAGVLVVDAGAAGALKSKGASLLPIGIKSVSGSFARGAVLKVTDDEGQTLVQGATRYNSEDLSRIMGRQSADIVTILGYEHGPVAIHRDDMLMGGQ